MLLGVIAGAARRRAGDADAAAYIAAVEAADEEALEAGVRAAYTTFIVGCKTDGIWDAIKAACILAGARTLSGALVPLVGPEPTNVGGLFVSADYSRTTGLIGDGSSKYLNTNAAHNIAPQNNIHAAVYASTIHSAGIRKYIESTSGSFTGIGRDTTTPPETWIAHDTGSSVPRFALDSATGFKSISRSNSTQHRYRTSGSTTTVARNASGTAPGSGTFAVFARPGGTLYSNGRLAYYSVGESLDEALLDARVTTLIADIAAAI